MAENPLAIVNQGAKALVNLFNHVVSILNALGSVWIFALMLLINADATGRSFFTAPIYGVNEMIELSIVGIVFLQLADATRKKRLTRSDGCFNILSRKFPLLARTIGFCFSVISMLFMGIILYGSYPLLMESIEYGYYVGEEGIRTFPVWPVKLVILIGCSLTLLQFLVFAIGYLRNSDDVIDSGPSVPGGAFKK